MSGYNYISNPNNLFSDDVDDDTFLKNSRVPQTNPFAPDLTVEQQRQAFQEKRNEIEQRTLQSSNRSIGLLLETEKVGNATAEELMKQREQLEKTTKQLDDINSTLRFSQKHLTGLKSVFGGLKNYLSGQKDQSPRLSPSSGGSQSASSPVMESPTDSDSHPVMRLRGDVVPQQQQQQQAGNFNFNEQLDRNLDEMVGSLSRLKGNAFRIFFKTFINRFFVIGLAMDLNQEIDTQNDLIDDISDKVENSDMKIHKQNRDMNKLLGKK